MRTCSVDGCNNKHVARGYCDKHYCQIKRCGHLLGKTRFSTNEVVTVGDHAEVIMTDMKGNEKARAIIDNADVEAIKQHKWSLDSKGYARGRVNGEEVRMHRFLLGLGKSDREVDHRDRNRLNNRRCNLRTCEHYVNMANIPIDNQCGVRGIRKYKERNQNPYKVEFRRQGKSFYVGYFPTLKEAKKAKEEAERRIHVSLGI